MTFAEKLKKLMQEQGLNQTQVCRLTGVGNSSISQYLSGGHEPSKARKREMAIALGVQETYFDEFLPDAEMQEQNECINLPVRIAAKLMKKSIKWVCKGLQDGRFPFGYAVKLDEWSYFISSIRFTQETGIKIPVNNAHTEQTG